MIKFTSAVAAMMLVAGPVAAQGDPMEMQRCIWRCLAASPGAASWQYNQCVSTQCSHIGQQFTPVPQATGPWRAGQATDGYSHYAGVDVPNRAGLGVYYFCNRARQSYLAVFGLEGPGGVLQFQIDGVGYNLTFNRARGELSFDLPGRSPFLTALSRGQSLRVVNSAGAELFTVPLGGAGASIQQARAVCGV